jgi:hypothetical protein
MKNSEKQTKSMKINQIKENQALVGSRGGELASLNLGRGQAKASQRIEKRTKTIKSKQKQGKAGRSKQQQGKARKSKQKQGKASKTNGRP